jgi:hypothetical protein
LTTDPATDKRRSADTSHSTPAFPSGQRRTERASAWVLLALVGGITLAIVGFAVDSWHAVGQVTRK